MSGSRAVVEDFIAAFNANDVDRVMSFFEEDSVYHNMPTEPVCGRAAIRAVIQGFMGMASEIDWVVRDIAESTGGRILTERNDRFLIGDRWVELPVMGSFEVHRGKISAWRDYFDMKQFQRQLPG